MDEILNIDLENAFSDRREIPANWLIEKDKLCGVQNDVLADDTFNFLVYGPAGSGKTILATYKLMDLLSLGKKDNVIFTVYTLALKEFIKSGLENTLAQYENDTLEKLGLHDLNIDSLNIHNIDSQEYTETIENKNIDYILVDEVQDINEEKLREILDEHENIMFFGDNDQMLYRHGTSLDKIIDMSKNKFKHTYEIKEHYRVPKKIMEFSSKIIDKPELVKNCKNKEDTEPQIKKYNEFDEEIDFVIKTINEFSLKSVGIFVNNNDTAIYVKNYLKNHNIECNYKIGLDNIELDFNDIDKPTLLTYHSSKGIQFENVFVIGCGIDRVYSRPEDDTSNLNYKNALFVACTRTTKRLFVTYSGEINLYMKDII